MSNKKNNIWQNPALPAAGIAALLSSLASSLDFNSQMMKIINACIPPLSIFLSYVIAWVTAKFYTLSIEEQRVISRLTAREKRIRNELKNDDISPKLQKELKQELENIVRQKCQIGKSGIVVAEPDE